MAIEPSPCVDGHLLNDPLAAPSSRGVGKQQRLPLRRWENLNPQMIINHETGSTKPRIVDSYLQKLWEWIAMG